MSSSQSSPLATRFDEPLDDDEFDALADDFESTGNDFDWATGFLTALVTGPELVPPSRWLPAVFGEDSLADIEDAEAKVGRVMRWYNEIAAAICGEEETICPPSSDHDRLAAFCDGYLAGADWHPQWPSDDKATALLLPFGVLSGDVDPSELRDENDRPIEDIEACLQNYREDLDLYVHALYEHWASARSAPVTRPRATKIGRNAPCPCGSGKKYKKCCLE